MEATQAENELKEAYLISGIASSLNDELAASVEALSMQSVSIGFLCQLLYVI